MANVDIEANERKAGSAARGALKASLLSEIRSTFKRRSGNLEKSNVTAKYKEGRLDRLVLNSPHYSFKNHYGSSLTGTQEATDRNGAAVKSFQRHLQGKTVQVQAHQRDGGNVRSLRKNRDYKAHNHIAKALKQTNALETLATALGENRMVLITSQIDF